MHKTRIQGAGLSLTDQYSTVGHDPPVRSRRIHDGEPIREYLTVYKGLSLDTGGGEESKDGKECGMHPLASAQGSKRESRV